MAASFWPLTKPPKNIIDASMRTTLDISDATLQELRARARESGRPFREVVEEALQIGLAGSAKRKKRPNLTTYPVGIKAAYRGVSMNQLYDQIEADEHLKVAEE